MEAYLAITGVLPSMKQWEDDMQAVKLPMKYKVKGDKKADDYLIRLGVARVQIYKLIFPRKHLKIVMAMSGASGGNFDKYPIIKSMAKKIRKMLGLQELPLAEEKDIVRHMWPNQFNKAVAVIPLGYKDDPTDVDGNEKL